MHWGCGNCIAYNFLEDLFYFFWLITFIICTKDFASSDVYMKKAMGLSLLLDGMMGGGDWLDARMKRIPEAGFGLVLGCGNS